MSTPVVETPAVPKVWNAYKVNFSKVKTVKEPVLDHENKPFKDAKGVGVVRTVTVGAAVDGSVTVVAESANAAGDLARLDQGGPGIEFNVYAVHEVAKNVILPTAPKAAYTRDERARASDTLTPGPYTVGGTPENPEYKFNVPEGDK